jgi:DNA-directed RNA polymerase subunit RPC12/RpoP
MKCPGQDTQYWKPGAIFEYNCPKCGVQVEFFKDDTSRKCSHCGHRFVNPKMDFGCAAYCQYAEQCIGDLPPEVLAQKDDLLKDRVAVEMKRHFKTDFKKIGRATRIARYAERIGMREGGSLAVILSAAYLHNIETCEAAAASVPSSGGASIARSILEKLGAQEPMIAEVMAVIAHRGQPTAEDAVAVRVVHDAALLADMEQQQKDCPTPRAALDEAIATAFLTPAGRALAEALLTGS